MALLITLLAAFGVTRCDGDASNERAAGDVPAAAFAARVLGDGQVEINVNVPSRHHAYLDAGEYGNLIPLAFDWQGLTPEPKITAAPTGEHDEEVKARVLRGNGRFVFQFAPPAPDLQGRTIKVRSQICDEDKGICYRPTWTDVSL